RPGLTPLPSTTLFRSSALAGIVSYEPAELILTARAATPLDVIDAALGARGQRLAFEPPGFRALLGGQGRPTLGGVLSANVSGSRDRKSTRLNSSHVKI